MKNFAKKEERAEKGAGWDWEKERRQAH